METIGAVAGLLSLGVFLWAVVGLINPGWARLPNRWASVKVWFVSVVLLFICGNLMEDGDTTPASPASRVPPASAVAEPAEVGCAEWNTEAFFKAAEVSVVTHCLQAGAEQRWQTACRPRPRQRAIQRNRCFTGSLTKPGLHDVRTSDCMVQPGNK